MTKQVLSPAEQALYDEMYCIADAKLVLAGWYMITIPNGRAIADWNAICGMMQDHYGHARALYGYLGGFGLTREEAEWTRTAKQIRSPELLDAPPESWLDLIVASYVTEQAIDTLLGAYGGNQGVPELAALAQKIGRESEFHFNYFRGWLRVLAPGVTPELERRLSERMGQMLRWWGPDEADDSVCSGGWRSMSRSQLKDAFVASVKREVESIGIRCEVQAPDGKSWKATTMRAVEDGIPEKLFELVRFKHIELAMP